MKRTLEKMKSLKGYMTANKKHLRTLLVTLSAVVVFVTTYVLILPAFTLEQETAADMGGIDIVAEETAAQEVEKEAAETENVAKDAAETVETTAENASATDDAKGASETASTTDRTEQAEAAYLGNGSKLTADGNGYTVTAAIDKDAKLPEGTDLTVEELGKNTVGFDYDKYYKDALKALQKDSGDVSGINFVKFYDISLMSDGESVEPSAAVNVTFEYDEKIKVSDAGNIRIVHFAENQNTGEVKAEVLDEKENSVDTTVKNDSLTEASFDAEGFSVYAVAEAEVEIMEATVLTADGSTYKVTVDVSDATNIPGNAVLEAKEIAKGTDEYEKYFNKTSEEIEGNMTLSFARFFDLTIYSDDEKIEPNKPAQVSIEYLGGTDIGDSAAVGVIHFAEDGVELIDPEKASIDGTQMMSIEYTQESFSVVGTIGTSGYTSINSVADDCFAVYAQKNGTAYALTHNYGETDIVTTNPTVLAGTEIDGVVVWEAEEADGGYYLFYRDLNDSSRLHYLTVKSDGSFGTSTNASTVWSTVSGYLKYQNGEAYGFVGFENGSLTTAENIALATQVFYATVDVYEDDTNDGLGPIRAAANLKSTSDAPAHSKTLTANGDGTYTLALSVTGATSSSSTTSVKKANVVLVLDTSQSMSDNDATYNGKTYTRLKAMQHVLTDTDGIVDKLLSSNTTANPDIIEIAVVSFNKIGYQKQDFSYNASTIKKTINDLSSSKGTNWESGLQQAKSYADSIKASQPDEDVYVIFLTDGEPTNHLNSNGTGSNTENNTSGYQSNWGYAKDDARAIVTAGYKFYGIFTWGKSSSSTYLSSLVQYAYTGSGTYNSSLDSAYAEYFTDASDTTALINALARIAQTITTGVGYTNVELTDGVTAMTTSNVKTTASGTITGLKYYRSGGNYSTTANNGLGEEWTDATEATINSKDEVDWNLGSLTLENGVTYTVTFVVWPSQESLDLVADLNNGKISYNDLTEDQKSQISISGGKYVLKTNTDSPTVTYSTVTTTTDSSTGQTTTVVSDPKTETIPNPDPVGLYSEKLTVEKLWDDATDKDQRPDSITLHLYKKDTGSSAGKYLENITLNKGNDWKLTDYAAIAPGIMVDSDSAAYSTDYTQVTYGGKTYAILESGHDYYFQEDPQDYHFELTAYTYHPMVINGTLYNVEFTYDSDGKITGIESMTAMSSITATNTLKGRLYVTKEVSIPEGAIGYDLKNTSFEITITLEDKDGNALTGTGASGNGAMYRIRYGQNNPNAGEYNSTYGNYGQTDQLNFSNGEIKVSIYAGDSIYVGNLPAGATYEVTESNIPDGWKNIGITYTDTAKKISGNDEDKVTVTNTLPSFDVEILKTQQDGSTALQGAVFSLYGSDYYTSTGAVNTDAKALKTGLTSGSDGKFALGTLGGGTYYLVETTAPDGYKMLTSPVKITVNGNSTATKDGKPLYVTYVQEGNSASSNKGGVSITESDGNYTYTLTVINNAGTELPMTGGIGTTIFYIVGSMLLIAGAAMILRRRRAANR